MRTAIYARFSTDKQSEQSTADQGRRVPSVRRAARATGAAAVSEPWPDLLRRIEAAGVHGDAVQRLLGQFLRLSEADPAGMELILEGFDRALSEWEDAVGSRPGLWLVTNEEP